MYSHETAIKALQKHDNLGKCGHAKCAGGDGTHCYEVGAPMRPYKKEFTHAQHIALHTKKENTYDPDCQFC